MPDADKRVVGQPDRGAFRALAHLRHRHLGPPEPHRAGQETTGLSALAQRSCPPPRRPSRPAPRTSPHPQRTPATLGPPQTQSRLTEPVNVRGHRTNTFGAGNSSADGEDAARLDRWHQSELQRTGNLQVSDRGTSHGQIVAQLRSNAADRASWIGRPRHLRPQPPCRIGSVILTDSWPGTDTSLDHLTVRNPARGHARERCGEADIRDQTPRPQEDTAARSAHPSPRITLSDEAAERERAHSRRSGRQPDLLRGGLCRARMVVRESSREVMSLLPAKAGTAVKPQGRNLL